ncbi:Hypothetical predicted protein, partial [Marmota monax]
MPAHSLQAINCSLTVHSLCMMEQDLVPEPRPLARYSEREVSGSKSSLLQITVPEKFDKNTNRKDVTETHVTYSITIEEKTYILSLKK